MSRTWVVVPTYLPIVLRRCHRCPSGRFQVHGKFRVNANRKLLEAWLLASCAGCGDTTERAVLNLLPDNASGLAPELLHVPVLRRRDLGVSGRSDRPAWQSPYGPPSHRAHRGRWAPVPGVVNPRSSLPREYLCGRCD
ncbi:DUF1062 domain-containing protein [Streptomyces sp. NPDC059979]|uniref:DUF1062 domain-containing protein n=1 Tax=Streptomyces sp. NPDC059979 TaxID=3347021 RepID=UPI0036AA904A